MEPGASQAGDSQPISHSEWKQLCEVMNGYIYSQTLVTGCDLGLFTLLSKIPGASQNELQKALGTSEHGTRVLMLAACACGLVRRDENGGYRNTSLTEKVLVETSSQSMVKFVQFNYRIQQRCTAQFTRSLREDRNAGLDELPGPGNTLYSRLAVYPELETLFQEAMGAYTRLSPKMVEVPEFDSVRHLLDVGGGNGSNAIRLCRRYPNLRVTALDIPSVTEIALATTQRAGLSDRVQCVARDMFTDDWGGEHDSVLLSHVVEIFSPTKIGFLYRKAYESLPVNGRLLVWTIMANDDETAALQAAKSSVYFLCVASGEGMAYPAKEHERLMREAGFTDVKVYPAAEVDHGAVVATR